MRRGSAVPAPTLQRILVAILTLGLVTMAFRTMFMSVRMVDDEVIGKLVRSGHVNAKPKDIVVIGAMVAETDAPPTKATTTSAPRATTAAAIDTAAANKPAPTKASGAADTDDVERLPANAVELANQHPASTTTAATTTTTAPPRSLDPIDEALRAKYPGNYDGSQMHIVFSNSCSQQHRLLFSTVLQESATRVGQKGPITQVLSGCTDDEKKQVLAEPRFYYDYRVHFTPDYSTHPLPEIDDWYLAYNKPFGLRHYLQNANPPVQHEMIALTDGDIMLLKPIEANTGRNVTKYYQGKRDPHTVTDEVRDGVALAQDWTQIIGSGFWGDKFGAGKLTNMCADKPCGSVSEPDGLEYYAATGPPYIMTMRDMRKFIDDYCHFVVESRKVSQEWMAEMFGYGVAAANHGIKHTILTHLAPTHPYLNGNEYWSFLQDESLKKNPCEDPFEIAVPADPPIGVHYFHYYMLREDGRQFHKGAIPPEILNCDHMMLEVPKASEYESVFTLYKDNAKYMTQKRVEVWLECTLIKSVNEALLAIKTATCAATGLNSYQGVVMNYEKQS